MEKGESDHAIQTYHTIPYNIVFTASQTLLQLLNWGRIKRRMPGGEGDGTFRNIRLE